MMRKGTTMLLFGGLLAWSASAGARTIYVSTTGDDATGDGSESNPYRTIQKGIDEAATAGDTVQVAAGTYMENVVWDSKSLTLQGAGAESTLVDGNQAGSCLTLTSVPDTARVEGFTFQNGSADEGGGLYLWYSAATLTHNTISHNRAAWGGGLLLSSSDATLMGNTIHGNRSYAHGGGLLLGYSDATLTGNTIYSNRAENWMEPYEASGGGLYLDGSAATLIGNTITSNYAEYRGGGLFLNSSAATLTNNTIASNHGPLQLRGGGLCLWDSAVTLTNNTIADNERQGVYLLSSLPTPTITNSILWGNEWDLVGLASATYSDIGRGNTKGKGNISKDPRFVGGGDYHLQQSSPCINRGNNAAPGLPDTDIDGDPRILDGTVDMGADEATDEPPTYDISGTVTDAKGGQSLAKVQVKLYDAKGLVDTAVTGTDGQYEFTDLPAETYRLKFSLKGYQSVTIKDVVVPPDQVVDVELRKKKSQATIHWIVPPAAEMTVGESQTVRWQVTGEEVTSTALTCSSGGDPITQAIAITTGVEVAPGVYEAMINAVSPGRWYYTAAAEVDGETIAIKPIAVMVR